MTCVLVRMTLTCFDHDDTDDTDLCVGNDDIDDTNLLAMMALMTH